MRRASFVLVLGVSLGACPPTEPAPTADPAPAAAFVNGFPTDETATRAQDEADLQRAITAYRFWYPTVSCEALFEGTEVAGSPAGVVPVLSARPHHDVFTANSDTPYMGANLDLSAGPFVVEIPPGAFVGLVNDHHQTWIQDVGLPGPDAGKGGKHLILPPGYDQPVPSGYFVGRSRSWKVLLAIRALPLDGDVDGAMSALKAMRIYPLSTASAPQLVEVVDTTGMPSETTPVRWEDNIAYWEKLDAVIQAEPMIEEWQPMYGLLGTLGIEKGKPFAPDARMKGILEQAARAGKEQLLVAAFASDRPDRIAWPDRRWEWAGLLPDVTAFETAAGLDLEARDRWFAQAIVTSPAMFRRSQGAGSLYWLGHRDATGAYLDGGKTYRLTVPLPVPGKLFWSVTAYDAQTRSEVVAPQDKAALRSMFELKDLGDAKTVDLYFGPEAPAGHEAHWIQTVPGRGWFSYFRIYGPEPAAFDGTWKPGDYETVE